MTPGETLKRAAKFVDRIHAESILQLESAGYPQDVVEGLEELRKALVGIGVAPLKQRALDGDQGLGGMLAQWEREEREERSRRACARGVVVEAGAPVYVRTEEGACGGVVGHAVGWEASGREEAVACFQRATARAREIRNGGGVQTADIVALNDLYEAIQVLVHSPNKAPAADTAVPGNLCVRYDGDERKLFDTLVSTLVSQQGWEREGIIAFALEIIKARRAFFEPEAPKA
jgi:hypothetical protein